MRAESRATQQDVKDEVNIVMAAKSTPSLIKALSKNNKSRMTGMTVQVKTNMFNTTH